MFEEDTSIFFDDFARRVTTSGRDVPKGGILDQPQEIITENGDVMMTDYSLLVKTSEFGNVKIGEFVEVDGVSFRVRQDPMKKIDGEFSVIRLMRASTPAVPAANRLTTLAGDFLVTIDGRHLVTL